MSNLDRQPNQILPTILIVLILAALGVGGYAWLRGSGPVIKPISVPSAIGEHKAIEVGVSSSVGVASVEAHILQNGKTINLGSQTFTSRRWLTTGDAPQVVHFMVQAGKQQHPELTDGRATLVVVATSANLRGASTTWQKDEQIETIPPNIYSLGAQYYIIQGGSGVVVYHVSAGASSSGVEVDHQFFPGHPVPGATPGVMFALYAFPYNAPVSDVPVLIARDAAGNQATANFNVRVTPQTYRSRPMTITDSFIQRVVMPIIANTPSLKPQPTLEQDFLLVNRQLRQTDEEDLAAVAPQSVDQFLWHGGFEQLPHAAVEAEFADHREYVYNGQIIDQEDHLGYDLASVEHAPVPAANAGRVVWAKYFGVYGNCILLDHGYGLMSLYGHLNDFTVKPGDMVTKGQIIGHTDSTGLAGGDHLHFSVLIDGVQVNPLEWWDPNWLKTHIEDELQPYAGNDTP